MRDIDFLNWNWVSECSEDERIVMTAWGIANLRWINRDAKGLVEHCDATLETVRAWLAEKATYQLSMFDLVMIGGKL
jgi:hypothetical protein